MALAMYCECECYNIWRTSLQNNKIGRSKIGTFQAPVEIVLDFRKEILFKSLTILGDIKTEQYVPAVPLKVLMSVTLQCKMSAFHAVPFSLLLLLLWEKLSVSCWEDDSLGGSSPEWDSYSNNSILRCSNLTNVWKL